MYTNNTMQKIRKNLKEINTLIKSFYPVGTTRDWKDGKYKKVADDKWVKVEEKNNKQLEKTSIKDLEVVTEDKFNKIIDAIFNNDYKNIPNITRLPDINRELAKKLGLDKNTVILMKNDATHLRPSRKENYEQSLRKDEYKKILDIIKNATYAIIDKKEKNFQIVFNDEQDKTKINKIVFNKSKKGNWIVTIGKINKFGYQLSRYKVVGVGVAPTISQLRKNGEVPATRLRPSPTTSSIIVPQTEEKSIQKSCWCYFSINKKTGETHFYIKKSVYDAYYNSKNSRRC